MSFGRILGWTVGAVLMYAVGFAIITRIPGAMQLLAPKA